MHRFVKMARAIATLEATSNGKRAENSKLNIDKAVMASYESASLPIMADAPVSALQGLTDEKAELLKILGVLKVKDLGQLKYAAWADAIVTLAAYEE
jgi:hypothetical protein